ncbi:hypothetical protein EAE96_005508 [Botrytis aclada]|nr:hypothetical protein EAE96_005508 [Botrytis aclada]
MQLSKALITAILAFNLVQGLPTQKRCDTCGGSDKESKIEGSDSQKAPAGYPVQLKPMKEFCEKCPPQEFFDEGSVGYGMTPQGMMGEFVVGLCDKWCGITYPKFDANNHQPRSSETKPPVHLTPEEQEKKDNEAKEQYDKEFHQYGGHGDLKKEAEEKKAADEKHAKEFHQYGGHGDLKKEAEEKKAADEKHAKEFHQFGDIKKEKKALAWSTFRPKDGEKQE